MPELAQARQDEPEVRQNRRGTAGPACCAPDTGTGVTGTPAGSRAESSLSRQCGAELSGASLATGGLPRAPGCIEPTT